tara:strand:- start:614 stop:1951 length:1338 start_codon:yes stop_codon:yes gene_type:complete
MQITHYCNAFHSIKIGKTVMVCDPYVGVGSQNSWISYPVHNNGAKILNSLKPNFIYISHLHCDHLDPKTISKYKNKNVKIIIKKFSDQRLKKTIQKLGFYNIMECKAWKKYKISKDISIAIVPQMASNAGDLPEQIQYDLDTSIIIQSNHSKKVFYNNVDNPLSLKNLIKVKAFIIKYFNKQIDIACLPVGAAGEYPQCFLNINRKKEKQRMMNIGLSNIKKALDILKPKAYFQAGGTYKIFGKYSALNKYIAIPSRNKISNHLKKFNYKVFNLEGHKKMIEKNGYWLLKKDMKLKKQPTEKKIIEKYLNTKYFYSNKYRNIKIKDIDDIYLKSCKSYKKKLTAFPLKTNWKVDFFIYKNLLINKNGKINFKNSAFLKKYSITFNKPFKEKFSKLKCHLDFNLFYGMLKKKFPWNPPLAGSSILFERNPNKFDPNVIFSLNYLSI